MREARISNRFDLDNYKNVLVFDDKLVITNNFYQSREHFLNREKNSRRDHIFPKDTIRKITYNSIGNTVKIYSKRRKKKLVFYSNQTRNEFMQSLNPGEFLNKTETDAIPTSKIASVLFGFTVLMVVLFYYADLQKILPMERFLFLVLGFVVAMYTLFKKVLKSVNIVYS